MKKILTLCFLTGTLFLAAKVTKNNTAVEYGQAKAYTIYHHYNGGGSLKESLVASYAATSQGFLWGMVLGPVAGAAIGFGVGA